MSGKPSVTTPQVSDALHPLTSVQPTSHALPYVLILDDDVGLCHLAKKRLERAGYRVTTVPNILMAQQQIDAFLPDVLVLDYDLKSDQTGLDFVRTLAQQGVTLPAILITGFTDESRVTEALRSGVADLLQKTGDYLDYLPAAVSRVISQIMLKRQIAAAELVNQRELYYRNLAEAIPQLVWTCRPSGECDFLSKQWLAYTGLPEALQLGNGWLQALHVDDVERTEKRWHAACHGAADYDMEYRLRRYDGQYRWFQARGVPMRDAEGKITKWFGTCTDIEDRKQSEQEREALLVSERAARSDAERAVRVKDEFVATLSHELRTPLNAIVGWAQFLLRDSSDPEKLRKGLDVIDRNAKLQAQMVDDLLDMSRIMSGKLRLDVVELDLADLVKNVVASAQLAADAKEITITATGNQKLPIHGDGSRLQQVLWNLLMNAIKFTPRQGSVQLDLRRQHSNAEIAVIDTGRGITAEFLPYVFDRFRQEDSSTTRKFSGLGLGLAITRQLLEMHGGSIEAASAGEGLGSTFTVRLPLPILRRGTALNHSLARPANLLGDGEPRLDGIHVLLVEDEPDGRDLVQRVLEDRGAKVTSCTSTDEALNAFAAERPDLVISDIGMPGQDGYEFIRRLRAFEGIENTFTPVAALTAMARIEDRRRALLAGFQAHIAKPVDPLELVVVLASLVGRNRVKQL